MRNFSIQSAVSHPFLVVVVLLIVLVSLVEDSSGSWFDPRSKLAEFSETIRRAGPPNTDSSIKYLGRVFYPIGYGADPTGMTDSFGAIMDCIKDAVSMPSSGYVWSPGLMDVGGVVIDLVGGEYLISEPLKLPSDISNLMIRSGTLRALSPFPGNRHLIELWATNTSSIQPLKVRAHKYPSNNVFEQSRFEGITFQDMLFDSSFRGGGLKIILSARIRVNHCFFIHFTTQGILVQKGHEIYISNSFFGQQLTVGGPDKGRQEHFFATAIILRSTDNAITNVVIFSAGTGIEVAARNNILTGVHCYNKATSVGGIGIIVRLSALSQTRIDNCYIDSTVIVVEDPVQVTISNCFFLRDAYIVLSSTEGQIGGLTIVNNMFYGSSNIPIVEVMGRFYKVNQVVIDRNNVHGPMQMKSTVARLTVSSGNGSQDKWVANFTDILVFPSQINHLQYSFLLQEKPRTFPLHSVTQVMDNVVVVESDQSVQGTVSVMVDQYNSGSEGNITMNTYRKP